MKRIITILSIVIPFILLQSCSNDDSFSIPALKEESVYMTRSVNNPTVPYSNVQFFSINDISGILRLPRSIRTIRRMRSLKG